MSCRRCGVSRASLEIRFPRVEGYRVELPEERLTADFNEDSVLELTPKLTGAAEVLSSGIIGEPVNMNLAHTGDVRPSQVLYELTTHLLMTKWRDPGEEPKLHLFGQLKRICKQWIDGGYLRCTGGTYPAQLKYKMIADMACEKITAAITRRFLGERPVKALLDPYNPTGSTRFVRFTTSRKDRWDTSGPPPKNQVNWVILDSDWEAEFCRVAEAHPRVIAYTKNHSLHFEVPYRFGSDNRKYRPDFIVLVDDGHGANDPLHLVVEIKGYRGEDAKEKKATMNTYWVPGINHLGTYGRWCFVEFAEVYQIASDFSRAVEIEFAKTIESVSGREFTTYTLARNRSESLVRRYFGDFPLLVDVTRAIWQRIESGADHSFRLSNIDSAAAEAGSEPDDVLTVLSLLSNQSNRLLDMKFSTISPTPADVAPTKFIRKLRDWWRGKTVSDAEWEQWASNVDVKWISAQRLDRY